MTQKVAPGNVTAEDNRLKALQLREGGAKYREIATQLGVTVGMAHRYVMEAMDELHDQVLETADRVKQIELNRLDAMWMKLALRKDNDAPRVIEAQIRIMERRARLQGLDAPVEIGGPGGGPIPIAASDARDILKQRVADVSRRLAAGESVATIVTDLTKPESGEAPVPAPDAPSTNGVHHE